MRKLARDPSAGLSLHGKPMARGCVHNPFALTQARHGAMLKLLAPAFQRAGQIQSGG